MKLNIFVIMLGLVLCLGITSCNEDEDGDDNNEETTDVVMEVFSWWTAPGEADAIDAVFDLYEAANENVTINNVASQTWDENVALLDERMNSDVPPDVFQSNGADEVHLYLDKLEVLNDVVAEKGWNTSVWEFAFSDVTIDGNVYAVPTNIHRENGVFYNMEIFEELQIDVNGLDSVDKLLEACQTIKDAGYIPIAVSYQGWIVRQLFNSIFLSTSITAFKNYYEGTALDEVALEAAVTDFVTILENYVNDTAVDNIEWDAAALMLKDKTAAMYFHGDWVKGLLQVQGWEAGVDFGVFASPGTQNAAIYGADTFAIPALADRKEEAIGFLETMLTSEGQVAFNTVKGSCPVLKSADLSQMDPVGEKICNEIFDAETRIHITATIPDEWDWDSAFEKYLGNDSECGQVVCGDEILEHYKGAFAVMGQK